MAQEFAVLPLSQIIAEFDPNRPVTRKRLVAPGEVELALATGLQFLSALAMFFAPANLLAGNGTALLTFASRPDLGPFVKSMWGLIFLGAAFVGTYALKVNTVDARKVAWQYIIPLWAAWMTGLLFPVLVGQATNIIVLGAVTVLFLQWLVVRILVPADSDWYSREVTVGKHMEEGR